MTNTFHAVLKYDVARVLFAAVAAAAAVAEVMR